MNTMKKQGATLVQRACAKVAGIIEMPVKRRS